MSQQTLVNTGKSVIILGGGLSGLSFAHYLRNFLAYYKKTNLVRKITLFEANDYMGGSVKSNIFDDNIVHEQGPRSIRTQGPKAQNTGVLLEQLGLTDRVLTINLNSGASRDRYVYRNGKMWAVPSSLLRIFKKLPGSDTRLIGIVMKDYMNKKRIDLSQYPHGDPPLYEFVKYRFGEEAAEAVLDPLLRGITAGDCRKWSTQGIFGDILAREQTYGGIMAGLTKPPVSKPEHDDLFANDCLQSELVRRFQQEKVVSYGLKTGLQTLPEHLSNSLLNSNDDDVVAIYNRTKALNISFNDELQDDDSPCSVVVETVDGDKVKVDGDHLVAALPAKDFTSLLNSDDSKISEEHRQALCYLPQIGHSPIGCVTVEYRNLNIKRPELNAFGFLTHSKAGSKLLGVAFDSVSFPQIDKDTNGFRMTCMMGGDWSEQVFGTSDMNKVTNAQLEQIALEEISKLLQIQDEPYRMSPILWKTGIAQYRPGHVEFMARTREMITQRKMPLTLLGQSYDGVAVNDVIYSARMAANEFAKSL